MMTWTKFPTKDYPAYVSSTGLLLHVVSGFDRGIPPEEVNPERDTKYMFTMCSLHNPNGLNMAVSSEPYNSLAEAAKALEEFKEQISVNS